MSQKIVYTKRKHSPAALECHLMKILDLSYRDSVEIVTCVDTLHSRTNNSLMVILSCIQSVNFEGISEKVNTTLKSRHHVNVSETVFLPQSVIERYIQKNNEVARFQLRDDILTGSLQDDIIYVHKPQQDDFTEEHSDECEACFDQCLPKPLSIKEFSLLQEWYMDIPFSCSDFA